MCAFTCSCHQPTSLQVPLRAQGHTLTLSPSNHYPQQMSCPDFYEWNARVQLTTWHPAPKGATRVLPSDYASKHWSGLIKDYYAARVRLHQEQALADAARGRPLNNTAVAALEAEHAYVHTHTHTHTHTSFHSGTCTHAHTYTHTHTHTHPPIQVQLDHRHGQVPNNSSWRRARSFGCDAEEV